MSFRVATSFALLCAVSCATGNSSRRESPPAVAFNPGAGREDWLYVPLSFHGQELWFILDTGAPITVLDAGLEPLLGSRLREQPLRYAWKETTAGIYPAPKLYWGGTPLRMGTSVWTAQPNWLASGTSVSANRVSGVLGMDCLRNYCVQLDFRAKTVQLLDPKLRRPSGEFGRPFRLKVYPAGPAGYVTVRAAFFDAPGISPIVDTGCLVDGVLEPTEFDRLVRQTGAQTKNFRDRTGFARCTAFVPRATFSGENYTDLVIDKAPPIVVDGKTNYINAVGLPFLARHVVVLNFPRQTMYLKRFDTKQPW